MKCSKGHEMEKAMSTSGAEDWVCYTCMHRLIDEAKERGMRSPSDKMIRSEDLITKGHEREKT